MMNFELSHAVDDSDVAFALRLDRGSTVCSMMSSRSTHFHKVGTNIDAFINLATVNYLLAGLQLCYSRTHDGPSKWFDLLHDLDQYQYPSPGVQLTLWDLRYITRELIVPFGVVRGSEKQGGQDETGISPATWPVNFVCNMVLDGHERNVVNYWHYHDINAGDDLVFRLKPMPIPTGKSAYTLNHYYKRFVQHNFESYFLHNMGQPCANHVWQLVPDVFNLDYRPENDSSNNRGLFSEVKMSPGFEVPNDYTWQEQGFWHIARSQVMFRKYAHKEYFNDDMANQLKVNHLDLTFEPTYTKVPGECKDIAIGRYLKKDPRRATGFGPVITDQTQHRITVDIAPGMMAPAAPQAWAPSLMLEGASMRDLIWAPMPGAAPAAMDAEAGQFRHDLDMVLTGAMPRAAAPDPPSAMPDPLFAMPALPAKRANRSVPAEEEPISLVFSTDYEPSVTVAAEAGEAAVAAEAGEVGEARPALSSSITAAINAVVNNRMKKRKPQETPPQPPP